MKGPTIELVEEMYAYYLDGHSPKEVGKKYGYTDQGVRKMFKKHGKATRTQKESMLLKSARHRKGLQPKNERPPLETMLNQVHNLDALELLRRLPDNCINCVVTSPPYWGLRDYGVEGQMGMEETLAEFIVRQVVLFREIRRVLRPDGVCFVNMGDSYASSVNGRSAADTKEAGGDNRTFRDKPFSTVGNGLKPKDLCGQPWRLAFALQGMLTLSIDEIANLVKAIQCRDMQFLDQWAAIYQFTEALKGQGWYLRDEIIWNKTNPMPNSAADRCTRAHEFVFMLTKSERYWYDQAAIREPAIYAGDKRSQRGDSRRKNPEMNSMNSDTGEDRIKRSVWSIPTQPSKIEHFATFPEELIAPMVLAGCPDKVCSKCGAPWKRIVEREVVEGVNQGKGVRVKGNGVGLDKSDRRGAYPRAHVRIETKGWQPGCTCNADTRPGIVYDPFMGVGTTAIVARKLKRQYIGSELSPVYWAIAHDRLRPPLAPRKYIKPDKPLTPPKPVKIGATTLQQVAFIE